MAATKTARKPATGDGHSPADYLQGALDELTKARERAGDDIRSGIDSAQEQVSDWRHSLDKATDEVRRELGILAVRAQRSPEALRAMSAEIRKRKTEIAPSK